MTRRGYKFNLADVGELRGRKAQSVRLWLKRRGIRLQKNTPVENLKAVVLYATHKDGDK